MKHYSKYQYNYKGRGPCLYPRQALQNAFFMNSVHLELNPSEGTTGMPAVVISLRKALLQDLAKGRDGPPGFHDVRITLNNSTGLSFPFKAILPCDSKR